MFGGCKGKGTEKMQLFLFVQQELLKKREKTRINPEESLLNPWAIIYISFEI